MNINIFNYQSPSPRGNVEAALKTRSSFRYKELIHLAVDEKDRKFKPRLIHKLKNSNELRSTQCLKYLQNQITLKLLTLSR